MSVTLTLDPSPEIMVPKAMRKHVDWARRTFGGEPVASCLRGYLNVRVGPPEAVERLKRDVLTARPVSAGGPQQQKKEEYPVWRDGPPGYLCVPRHLGAHVFGAPQRSMVSAGTPIPHVRFEGTLQPFQEKVTARVLESFEKDQGAVVVASCGTGKTVMAISLICSAGVKTAIVVHKEFLLKQWAERLAQFAPGARVGIVQRDRQEAGPEYDVSLCMMHSLLGEGRYPRRLFEPFGLLVFDETHHISARTFIKAAGLFPARLRLGLTATPRRQDGLGYLLTWLLGPVVCEAKRQDGARVRVRRVDNPADRYPTIRNKRGDVCFSTMITTVVKDPGRIALVAGLVAELLASGPRRNILVASDRVQHLRDLQDAVRDALPPALADTRMGLYVGASTKKARAERAANGETCRVLFTSFRMGEEGLDIPRMNTLVLASPKKQVEQLVGRITRGKGDAGGGAPEPLVVDVVDVCNRLYENMYTKRRRTYRRLGFSIE